MEYSEFLESKTKQFGAAGFELDASGLNSSLFAFQADIVVRALQKGRYAIFADCGLGKTLMQLEWAHQICKHESRPVLILAPLAVVAQTIQEGQKFGIDVSRLDVESMPESGIHITNYEQLKNIDTSAFIGVVLDESSILKGNFGKTSTALISQFASTPYRLCCSATPSPNDHKELGQHAEFLGVMSYLEMLAMYFVHDGGETSKWRLRKHAQDDFWKFVCTWSTSVDNPATLGYEMDGYNLPAISYIEHFIEVETTGKLFADSAVSATQINADLRRTMQERVELAVKLANETAGPVIIWCLHNKEADLLAKMLPDAVNVQGSDKPEKKAKNLLGFANGDFRILITKAKIASFGMNYQHCSTMIFCSYDFKFEAFYQAVRRCYRFGQKQDVSVHILIPESQQNVRKSILTKQAKHEEKIRQMSLYSAIADFKINTAMHIEDRKVQTDMFTCINGDCVQETAKLPDNCADIAVFSPPFADLYVYSDKPEDMGNVSSYEQFAEHFKYLIPHLSRVIKPGRICAVHCMDLPIQKGKEGFIGLRDFSGMLVDWFRECGFIYHSRVTIWKNPVTEMQRTKALGLLHKQIKKDSVMSRVGIPDYVLFFRNAGDNEVPIVHQDNDEFAPDFLPVDMWQKYASPVWFDVDYTRTLQYTTARDNNDEKHICPLQLDTIERILHLYSNECETVFSPFGGIGSEGYTALKMGRKSISIELKESYFAVNVRNHKAAIMENAELQLF